MRQPIFFCPHLFYFFAPYRVHFSIPSPVLIFLPLPGSNRHDLQLIMQKLLAMAVSTVMTKLMIVFHVSFFIALKF